MITFLPLDELGKLKTANELFDFLGTEVEECIEMYADHEVDEGELDRFDPIEFGLEPVANQQPQDTEAEDDSTQPAEIESEEIERRALLLIGVRSRLI